MFDFLGQQPQGMGNPMGGFRMPQQSSSPTGQQQLAAQRPMGAATLGAAPMNLLPQQQATQPGQPPMGGLMSLLGGLGAGQMQGQGQGLNGMQSILSGLGMQANPSFIAGLMGKGGLF